MEFYKEKNAATSISMVEGAIFMSNRRIKKECLARKLFGLPHSQASFVKQVKTGMILFLFEYEERKLFGVFEAASDGGLNIDPHAFNSYWQPITAQIRFQRIWSCYPLSEPEFSVVIKDNYYTSQRFHLHLSQEQVYNLLALFSAKRISVQRPRIFRAGNEALKQSQEHHRGNNSRENLTSDSIDSGLGVDDDVQPANFSRHLSDSSLDLNRCRHGAESILNREDFIGKRSLGLPVSRSTETSQPNFSSSISPRDDGAIGHLHVNPVQGHHCYGADHSFCRSSHMLNDSILTHEIDAYSKGSRDCVLSSRSHLPIRRFKFQTFSTRHEDLGFPTNHSGHRVSSHLVHHEPSSSSTYYLGTGYPENTSINPESADYIDLPFTDCHEVSGACKPFRAARYFEKRNINSSDEYVGHGDLSLRDHYEPSRSIVPFLQAASFGEESIIDPYFMCHPSKNLLELGIQETQDQSPTINQNEGGCVGTISGCYEPSKTANCILGDEFASNRDPYRMLDGPDKDAPSVSGYGPALESHDFGERRHHSSTHDKDYHILESGFHSDHLENRPSVFSRLSAARASSFQDYDRYESDEEISIGALPKILSQRRKEWRRWVKYYKPLNERISGGQSNSELVTSVQIIEEDQFEDEETTDVCWESPFLDFKRRSQVHKMHEDKGKRVEGKENEQSSSGKKRRKLIRPPLVPEEHFDRGNKEGTRMDGSYQGVATNVSSIQRCEAITDAMKIEVPVKIDRMDESAERNLSPQVGSDDAMCPNSNRDDCEKLKSSSNHIHGNTVEKSKLLSDGLKSAKEIEISVSGAFLESQTNQLSGGSVNSQQNVECLFQGNEKVLKPANLERTLGTTPKNNGIQKMAITCEPAAVENFTCKGNAEEFLAGTGTESAKQKSEALQDHQAIKAASDKNELQKMPMDGMPAMVESVDCKEMQKASWKELAYRMPNKKVQYLKINKQ